MKFDNQLRYASTIISAYQGDLPLHAWLKDFFRAHKQMGSRDRKLLSSLAYSFYRLGRAFEPDPGSGFSAQAAPTLENKILAAFFLCRDSPHELLAYFRPEWNEQVFLPESDKIALCRKDGIDIGSGKIFPWKDLLSEGIDPDAYGLSFLQQPDLFLRIRPGHEQEVIRKLGSHNVEYAFIPPFTIRLPNGTKTEEWFTPDKEIVIQDYSSQRTGAYLQLAEGPVPRVWDACAASGGKSLLAYDLNPAIDLTVSDIRESIIRNLKERFKQAGIVKYRSFTANLGLSSNPGPSSKKDLSPKTGLSSDPDLTSNPGLTSNSGFSSVAGLSSKTASGSAHTGPGPSPAGLLYDLVIADVPCSGSGTWGRTPEELYFFDKKRIREYSELQRKILSNLLPSVKRGGHFVYITCSVFREENEAQVSFIQEHSDLILEKMELLKGYNQRADTLFAARFIFPPTAKNG